MYENNSTETAPCKAKGEASKAGRFFEILFAVIAFYQH